MRSLYAKSNKVIRMFNHCTVDVKLLLIKSYVPLSTVDTYGLIVRLRLLVN